VPVPEFVGYMEGSEAAHRAFREQAERDLSLFLECRAEELAPGGKLLIVMPGSDGPRCTGDGLYHVLNDACLDLVQSGRLGRAQYERLVFPVYFRSLDELVAPIDRPDSRLRGAFTVERAEVQQVPSPFVEQFERTGDLATYAAEYAGFLRATSEPVVTAALAVPEGAALLADALYDRVRERLVADPRRYRFHNIEVALLLSRA
jgi:hypothetical protein